MRGGRGGLCGPQGRPSPLSSHLAPRASRLAPRTSRWTPASEASAWIKSNRARSDGVGWRPYKRDRGRASRAPCHSLRAAAQVHVGYGVVRAFDEPRTTACARRQHPLRQLLAMNDGACRTATLLAQRGSWHSEAYPLTHERLTRASPAAAATRRVASARYTPQPLTTRRQLRGAVFAATRFVSRARQVVDGRACGRSGPKR